jgi:hypothetical protein
MSGENSELLQTSNLYREETLTMEEELARMGVTDIVDSDFPKIEVPLSEDR